MAPSRGADISIFICYRRADTGAEAVALRDKLSRRRGFSVFADVASIKPGQDWFKVAAESVDQCDVMLVLIGSEWVQEGDGHDLGKDDQVRYEIEAALERGKAIIPVLFQNTAMPRAEQLPVQLQALRRHQAVEIRNATFDRDLHVLVAQLRAIARQKFDASSKPDTSRRSAPAQSREEVVRQVDIGTLALGGAVLGAALFALSIGFWGGGNGPASITAWIELVTGSALALAGATAARRRSGRRIGRLMLAAALLYFVPYIRHLYQLTDLAWLVGSVTVNWWLPVAAHMALSYPDGRLRSRADRLIVWAGYVITIGHSVALKLFENPLQLGCGDYCPVNPLLLYGDAGVFHALVTIGNVLAIALAGAVFGALAAHFWRATRPERLVLSPMFIALLVNVAAYLGLGVVLLVAPGAGVAAYVAQSAAVVLVPVGLFTGLYRSVVAKSAIGNLLVRIGQGSTVAELEREVAWALGDPSARLAMRTRDESSFVDRGGARIEVGESTDRAVSLVEGSAGTAAAIVHDPSLRRDQPELLDAVIAATSLALDNQRLEAAAKLVNQVPASLAERLLRLGARIGDSQTLVISVLMTDIRGYSAIAEHAEVHDLAAQLNDHRRAMNKVITARGGTVMQFVGDSVFAVFGAPERLNDHATQAVQAAMAAQKAQRSINEGWSAIGRPEFGLGIGITTGEVAAALLGSAEHVEYSVVGDVVNLAQRLQGWAKQGEIVISDTTYAAMAGAVPAVQLPKSTVKGREAPVAAYLIAASPTA